MEIYNIISKRQEFYKAFHENMSTLDNLLFIHKELTSGNIFKSPENRLNDNCKELFEVLGLSLYTSYIPTNQKLKYNVPHLNANSFSIVKAFTVMFDGSIVLTVSNKNEMEHLLLCLGMNTEKECLK